MVFSISLVINLKNNQDHTCIENIILDSARNLNTINIFYDYELSGINNYIKNNNKIIIIEFDHEESSYEFCKFVKTLKKVYIEYVYYENNIIYGCNKYINAKNNLINKYDLLNKIEDYKLNNKNSRLLTLF